MVVGSQRPFDYQRTPAPRFFTTFSPTTFFSKGIRKNQPHWGYATNSLKLPQSTSPEKIQKQIERTKKCHPKAPEPNSRTAHFLGVFFKNIFSWIQAKFLLFFLGRYFLKYFPLDSSKIFAQFFFWKGEDYFYIKIFSWICGDSFP